MGLFRLAEHVPVVPKSCWVAPTAAVVGRVSMGERCSVWFSAVLRGDSSSLTLGQRVNVQDGAVLHADDGFPLVIGDDVTIGHQATVHGCTLGAGCLVGIQAVIMNGAVIGAGSLVGAGALVTEGKQFPPRSLVVGSPARLLRVLTPEESERLLQSSQHYANNGERFANQLQEIEP
jgi:carbonic anhydrase/acetyltransferase-like protein (isoleucine patch superfamily)